ncbi:hypothetical protein NIES4073_09660 [Kalymmatonema gypsitolerans NIES-4073]|nr:hypothetical protein NIES4073_09660 [Scytonema sp. NIES-4073]
MKFQAIFMRTAVTVAVFTGLTLSHQESAQAIEVCIGGTIFNRTINLRGQVLEENTGRSCSTNNNNNQAQVPTPALLPGLIGLGVGLLRKRKAKEAEVNI